MQQYWDTILADPNCSDHYIRDNLKWSGVYIRKTISQSLLEQLLNEIDATTIGPVTLLALLCLIYSDGYDAIELLKDDLKAIDLKKFPGENVDTCCVKLVDICERLDAADAFNQEYLCNIARIFELSSERRFQDWTMKTYCLCQEQVKGTQFQGVEAYRAGLADPTTFITYTSLCKEAKQEYHDLLHSNRYGPSKSSGKNDDPPALQATVQSAVQKAMNAVLKNSGLQPKNNSQGSGNSSGAGAGSGNSSSSSGKICDYCKKDHGDRKCWKKFRDDQKAKKNAPNGTNNGTAGSGSSNSNGNNGGTDGGPHWTKVPPTSGDPATATQQHGSNKYKWCTQCNMWTYHWTSGHQAWLQRKQSHAAGGNSGGGGSSGSGGSGNLAAASLDCSGGGVSLSFGGLYSISEE